MLERDTTGVINGVETVGATLVETQEAKLVDVPNGLLKGDGTTISAAVAGTDYVNSSQAIRYDAAQSLTDAQKTQARANIAAAPDGYGLGGTAKVLTAADDLNNITTTGWYCYHIKHQPANVPTPALYSAVMEVIHGFYSDQIAQRVYSTGDDNDWNLVLQRVFYGNRGWQPWEWVNPPMQLGVEYRTTERYLGKPVYVRTIDFGTLPNNTMKIVTFGDDTIRMISAHGIMTGGYVIPGCTGSDDYQSQEMQILTSDGGNVGIMTHVDRSDHNAIIVAKYWKTTD